MDKKDFILRLMVSTFKRTLDLDNNVNISVSEIPKTENIRITLEMSKNSSFDYLNKWSKWKNAYKYRKR